MKAIVADTVIAEAPQDDVLAIEGNAYFPPGSVLVGTLQASPTSYTCPWKGDAQYYDLKVGQEIIGDGAWSYPLIKESAVARVGRDFSGYIAFDTHRVRIG